MASQKSWSALGVYEKEAKVNTFGIILAVITAAETLRSGEAPYKQWMSALILVSGVFIAKKAFDSGSYVGILTGLFTLVWILPIVDSTFFYSVDATFMTLHSIYSLAVAAGAYSYLKN
ncbi:hypothetical protein MCEMRE26_00154 [Candidatus Nanopelagicaceae bacterium]